MTDIVNSAKRILPDSWEAVKLGDKEIKRQLPSSVNFFVLADKKFILFARFLEHRDQFLLFSNAEMTIVLIT